MNLTVVVEHEVKNCPLEKYLTYGAYVFEKGFVNLSFTRFNNKTYKRVF